jgi:esterase/lipase superfamily enzyme
MPLARFGWYGKPLVLFPTGGGDYLEHERFLMIRALEPLIDGGRIKVYTVGNVNREGWISPDASPRHKTWLQARFSDYLATEVVPLIRHDCADTPQRFVAAGASLGAYNAVNLVLRQPEAFDLAITMSGTFDLTRWVGRYRDADFHANHPLDYVPELGPSRRLGSARFVLGVGRGPYENPRNSFRLAEVLGAQGIWNRVELWGTDADHDWPTWRRMLPRFLDTYVEPTTPPHADPVARAGAEPTTDL